MQIIWKTVFVQKSVSRLLAAACHTGVYVQHARLCEFAFPCSAITVVMRSCHCWNTFHLVIIQFTEGEQADIKSPAGKEKKFNCRNVELQQVLTKLFSVRCTSQLQLCYNTTDSWMLSLYLPNTISQPTACLYFVLAALKVAFKTYFLIDDNKSGH